MDTRKAINWHRVRTLLGMAELCATGPKTGLGFFSEFTDHGNGSFTMEVDGIGRLYFFSPSHTKRDPMEETEGEKRPGEIAGGSVGRRERANDHGVLPQVRMEDRGPRLRELLAKTNCRTCDCSADDFGLCSEHECPIGELARILDRGLCASQGQGG